MTPTSHRRPALPAVLALLALAVTGGAATLTSAPLAAHEFTGGTLELVHPNAPPTPPGVSSAAGYLVIVNSGDEDDRLLGGSAPFASGIELHRTTVEDDVARMRRLDDGLAIPAGSTVRLDPGETHIMFTGLAEALPDGERRPATLVFERAGEIEVEFAIEPPDTSGASADAMDHGSMHHGEMDHGEMDHGEPVEMTDGEKDRRSGTTLDAK